MAPHSRPSSAPPLVARAGGLNSLPPPLSSGMLGFRNGDLELELGAAPVSPCCCSRRREEDDARKLLASISSLMYHSFTLSIYFQFNLSTIQTPIPVLLLSKFI
ncbi:hypothetical protein PVAP13_6NG002199 [Panicum virgatum]|uniref:Uncharacterized protein n=1 Tax=Panicum virgatum TaxID=38727 RepID=A0A8T0QSE8_PANVG|nr:hypothetical protein PVAP13_6NG002199 [Panicum virgatum]